MAAFIAERFKSNSSFKKKTTPTRPPITREMPHGANAIRRKEPRAAPQKQPSQSGAFVREWPDWPAKFVLLEVALVKVNAAPRRLGNRPWFLAKLSNNDVRARQAKMTLGV